ncbi:MAG: hypothetical protein E7467_05135 [Ruminococcaceae bacterium]|nr:hypothetical protein [Oscillospiraceae bacterium]
MINFFLQRRQEFRITKPITTGERSASACRESVKREGGLKTELGSNDSFNATIGFLQRLSLVVFFGDFLGRNKKVTPHAVEQSTDVHRTTTPCACTRKAQATATSLRSSQ